jgi:N-acetylneuraminic acid mutarotase
MALQKNDRVRVCTTMFDAMGNLIPLGTEGTVIQVYAEGAVLFLEGMNQTCNAYFTQISAINCTEPQ